MTDKPGLDAAYDLSDAGAVKKLYAKWAETYDSGFAAAHGYDLHRHVATHFIAAGGNGPMLDVGAGTGLVGEVLAAQGIGPIEGTDISAEMLAAADAKGCYARTFVADITGALDVADDSYAGVISAGTFTLGHLGPEPLSELIRITRPGGLFAITVNVAHWDAAGFGPAFDTLAPRMTQLTRHEVAIYSAGADHDHAGDRGYVVTFRVA